ncbi:hypothetical protein CVT26_004882 [Gymnopilus dilepis]|uniref:F-box domain-containing protein n=1 Tax=Gymnopilus dilepis TaxID=231916 RepID=A0A409W8C9_9AGAR|nr:hypothetical protein CVT26_004882 [Gymnopilus dilepis]
MDKGSNLHYEGEANESRDSFKLDREDMRVAQLDHHIRILGILRAYICRSRNQIVAINCLPFEVLSQIFVLGNIASELDSGPVQPTVFPLILGSVCYKWRCVAWGSSELWESFHCRISKARCDAQAMILRGWLQRSQQRMLSICISIRDEDAWTESSNVSTSIIDAIVPYCERWTHLGLILPEAWYQSLNQAQGKVPNLASLSIRPPMSTSPPLSFGTFAQATSIRSFFASHYDLANIHLRWDVLKKVVLEGVTTNEAIDVIRRGESITSCRFNELGALEHDFPRITNNSSIQDLEISTDEWADLDEFLDFLVLPGLRSLTVTLPEGHPDPLFTIEALISRSTCPLKSVDIRGVEITDEDLIAFVSHSDTVTTIRVRHHASQ